MYKSSESSEGSDFKTSCLGMLNVREVNITALWWDFWILYHWFIYSKFEWYEHYAMLSVCWWFWIWSPIIVCWHTGEEWLSKIPVWPHQQCIANFYHSICMLSFLTQRVCPLENLVQILFLHFGQRSYVVASLHKHTWWSWSKKSINWSKKDLS